VLAQETVARADDSVTFGARDAHGKRIVKGFAESRATASGNLAGTRAWVQQTVDKSRASGGYIKRVTLSDGTVVKDVGGPLTDQTLHGPQRPTR
jgi:hypothetical protein